MTEPAEPTAPRSPLAGWLATAIDREASDLHVAVGHPPALRVNGRVTLLDLPALDSAEAESALLPYCPADLCDDFRRSSNIDFALQLDIGGRERRFRANYFFSGQAIGACLRVIPDEIPAFEWAGFPFELADRLAHFRNGLVIVSGMSGAGKTTTLAMIVNLLNQEGGYRIITIEDPVEYLFPPGRQSIITQREVGRDVDSFADGLKFGLRQDPDIILVGEIRDHATAQMALSAAETGHLVFATLHTRDAKGAVTRFADLFPQSIQNDVRAQLAMSLRAVVAQHLLPSASGDKRRLALEIMFNNSPIASAIRQGKLESIDMNITTGRADGMLTLDESIKRLLRDGLIDQPTAERHVTDPQLLWR